MNNQRNNLSVRTLMIYLVAGFIIVQIVGLAFSPRAQSALPESVITKSTDESAVVTDNEIDKTIEATEEISETTPVILEDFILTKTVMINSGQVAGLNLLSQTINSEQTALEQVSVIANYLIAFCLLAFIFALSLLIKNTNQRASFGQRCKLVPRVACCRPADTFNKLAQTDDEGSWSNVYARHRRYHKLSSASFWGMVTAVTGKVVLVAMIAISIKSGAASLAQPMVNLPVNQAGQAVELGDQLTYQIKWAYQPTANQILHKAKIIDSIYGNNELVADSLVISQGSAYYNWSAKQVIHNLDLVQPGDDGYLLFTVKVTDHQPVQNQAIFESVEGQRVSNMVDNPIRPVNLAKRDYVVVLKQTEQFNFLLNNQEHALLVDYVAVGGVAIRLSGQPREIIFSMLGEELIVDLDNDKTGDLKLTLEAIDIDNQLVRIGLRGL